MVLSTEVCRDDLRVWGLGKRGREGDRPGGPIFFLLSLRLYEPLETDIFATLLKIRSIFPKYRQINDTRGGREDEGRRATTLRVREVLFLCPNVRGSRFRFLIGQSRALWSLSVRHKSLPFEKTTLTQDIMSDQNETTTTTPSEPKLCNAGCGFFVSSSMGWCWLITAGS